MAVAKVVDADAGDEIILNTAVGKLHQSPSPDTTPQVRQGQGPCPDLSEAIYLLFERGLPLSFRSAHPPDATLMIRKGFQKKFSGLFHPGI
jgi:hypothetical protein